MNRYIAREYQKKTGFKAIGEKIALIAKRRKEHLEARRAADTHVVMSKETARKMGGAGPEQRRRYRSEMMRRIKKDGLSAVVQQMEHNVISYYTRENQPTEVTLIKAEDKKIWPYKSEKDITLWELDAERARITKLKQISRLAEERRLIGEKCGTIILRSHLKDLVENTRPKTLRQLTDWLGKILIARKPFVGKIFEQTIESTTYGERVSIFPDGSWTLELFRNRRSQGAYKYRLMPDEIRAFKEYYRATGKWHTSLDEYQKQEWHEIL